MRIFRVLILFSVMVWGIMGVSPTASCTEVDRSILPATDNTGYFGYIDAETGETLFPFIFREAGFFGDGLAIVEFGKNTPQFKPGAALMDRSGNLILEGLGRIEPAYVPEKKVGRHPYKLEEGDGALSRVFVVYGKPEKLATYSYDIYFDEIGVYDADKGWRLPLSPREDLSFVNAAAFVYDGYFFVEGKKMPMPKGFVVERVHFEDGYVEITEREEKTFSPAKYGILRLDGSVWVPPKYHFLSRAGDTGFWIASRFKGNAISMMLKLLAGGDGEPSPQKNYVNSDVFDASGKKLRSFSSHDLPDIEGDTYEYYRKGRRHIERLADGAPVAAHTPTPASRRRRTDTRASEKDSDASPDVKKERIEALSKYDHWARSRHPPFVYRVEQDGRIGLADARGKEIIPCNYVHFYEAGTFYFRAKDRDGMIFYVDRSGKEYRPKEMRTSR